MEPSPPSPPPSAIARRPKKHDEMEIHASVTEDPTSSALWDWGDLLDFTVDDQFPISFDSIDTTVSSEVYDNNNETNNHNPVIESTTRAVVQDRVRKRDPRLTCSNFLAGRVPCACPELDEKLLEEEESLPGKKRVRTTRSSSGITRCQVPGCEVDISELKGYHKRHRVCLRCATAGSVLLDGHRKRYCQQCGKFHLLPDFDEGKRSCRRKLERHNDRRRRKPHDSKGTAVDKEIQGELQSEETACEAEAGKDGQIIEKEAAVVESEDGNVSALHSDPNSQNLNSDSGLSVGTPKRGGKDDTKFSFSPSNCDNKSSYSSLCPTGRISFKLYDWNPAEFPRRLRHQIFEWLASMPVELEGYIRPGCTILTAFLAMPTFMWAKLFEDPMSYVHDLVIIPGKMLSKRGPMLIYLNNMIFHVMKDGNSVMKVNIEGRAPRLHYVHPTCFEAGKPIEFVACGSNLLQPKFRLLVSFSGKYLAYDYCVALPHGHTEGCSGLDHQLCKIFIPHIEPNVFGPAFIEVENESGVSNFIPVLIGDREICSEMKIIQQRFDASHLPKGSQCEVSAQRQMAFSELLVDIAWLLKKPSSESSQRIMSSSQIQRLNSLLNFLLLHEATAILDKALKNLKIILMETEREVSGSSDADMKLLQKHVDWAWNILYQKVKKRDGLLLQWECTIQGRSSGKCSDGDGPSVAPFTSEDLEKSSTGKLGLIANTSDFVRSDKVPLLNKEVVMNVNLVKDRPNQSCSLIFSKRVLRSRPTVFLIATVAVCFGVCAIILHPNQVSRFAVSVRRCLTDRF
ncbi:squamosa promoter-binding-like protein 7 [Ricinus communis]|uniref:Squamosa promoter-binding protein, putative n=1 Tax=Ricinus communis TaxID=3988 RepID=B9RSX0_RICCO|nr:squamosa promoter-binding-like protein 7 [Ricinus communis]EEF45453.1 Squamosa promoter-binding protein, putative [Ricinus communis]|eukprot:XP_002516839.1 squamosa promoter-binding-like protein 7 [Ricinus communis]